MPQMSRLLCRAKQNIPVPNARKKRVQIFLRGNEVLACFPNYKACLLTGLRDLRCPMPCQCERRESAGCHECPTSDLLVIRRYSRRTPMRTDSLKQFHDRVSPYSIAPAKFLTIALRSDSLKLFSYHTATRSINSSCKVNRLRHGLTVP
jgi:hypothetical protein